MNYENVSDKDLGFNTETVSPGETVEKTEDNENEIENFVEAGYLEPVEEKEEQEKEPASEAESDSGGQESANDEDEEDVAKPSQEFIDKIQELEGIGSAKAEHIAREWDEWSTFRDNVDREYLDEKGLRKDQVEANLEKLEEME